MATDLKTYPGKEPSEADVISPADHARERALHPDARNGYYCSFEGIMTWGLTEKEALTNMILEMMVLVARGYRTDRVIRYLEENGRTADVGAILDRGA